MTCPGYQGFVCFSFFKFSHLMDNRLSRQASVRKERHFPLLARVCSRRREQDASQIIRYVRTERHRSQRKRRPMPRSRLRPPLPLRDFIFHRKGEHPSHLLRDHLLVCTCINQLARRTSLHDVTLILVGQVMVLGSEKEFMMICPPLMKNTESNQSNCPFVLTSILFKKKIIIIIHTLYTPTSAPAIHHMNT